MSENPAIPRPLEIGVSEPPHGFFIGACSIHYIAQHHALERTDGCP